MRFEGPPQPTPEDEIIQTTVQEEDVKSSPSAGEVKVNEYVNRIQGGESKEVIFQGLPESFITSIENKLRLSSESSPNTEPPLLGIDERKKLNGWSASYELAKIAKQQGLNLSTFSREEYVDYAIQNSLAITDSQLRMTPWQRMCESPQEIIATNKEKRALINEETDKSFSNFCLEIQKKAGEDDRSIQDRIHVRQGTKDSNSWLFFKVNDGTTEGVNETFKSYISVKDLNTLTPERFTSFMRELRDAGYNGDIKIFQDLMGQGINLNDQIVMHGASENDAKLALDVAQHFFGDELDQKSIGKDEIVDGKNQSYSEILAKKIKDAINTDNRSFPS